EEQILIISRYEGLFLFHPKEDNIQKFPTAIDDLLLNDRIQAAQWLHNGNLAIASSYNGLYLLTPQGELLHQVDKSTGLADQSIWDIHQDRSGNLWMATNNGLAKVEVANGLEYWDDRNQLEGTILSLNRYQGKMYAATTNGIYVLEKDQFRKLKGLLGMGFDLKTYDPPDGSPAIQFLAGDKGLLKVNDQQSQSISPTSNVHTLFLIYQKEREFIFSIDAIGQIYLFRYNSQQKDFELYHTYDELLDHGIIPSSLSEDDKGHIWLGTEGDGVVQLPQPLDTSALKINHFLEEAGLQSKMAYSVGTRDGKIFLYGQNGLYQLDQEKQTFVLDSIFTQQLGFHHWHPDIYPLTQNKQGDIWLFDNSNMGNKILGAIKNKEPGYTIDTTSLKRIGVSAVTTIYPEADGSIWIASPSMLYRYRAENYQSRPSSYSATINQIYLASDSLFFTGNVRANSRDWLHSMELPYPLNTIRFNFGASSYEAEEQTQFSYRLLGYDNQWSSWSKDQYKEYTNFREGDYTFELKAKNVYGQESDI
ncbi:MAG: two-component regulator propeller domain-containing protein, partial [Bacteroidota bacterium]